MEAPAKKLNRPLMVFLSWGFSVPRAGSAWKQGCAGLPMNDSLSPNQVMATQCLPSLERVTIHGRSETRGPPRHPTLNRPCGSRVAASLRGSQPFWAVWTYLLCCTGCENIPLGFRRQQVWRRMSVRAALLPLEKVSSVSTFISPAPDDAAAEGQSIGQLALEGDPSGDGPPRACGQAGILGWEIGIDMAEEPKPFSGEHGLGKIQPNEIGKQRVRPRCPDPGDLLPWKPRPPGPGREAQSGCIRAGGDEPSDGRGRSGAPILPAEKARSEGPG
jgi:hypothetical protein